MHREPRNADPGVVVVHVPPAPEVQGGAAGIGSYLDRIDGGYHKLTDDKSVITKARDDEVVWGASGMNRRGLHVCVIGQADQTSEQWHDPYSTAAIRNTAVVTATWCAKFSIPVGKLTPAQVAQPGIKGICGHFDVERSGLPGTGGPSGHWDPGPNFPWTEFIALVARMLGAPVPPSQEDHDVPKPTDVTGVLETKHGLWHLHADGGVFTIRGRFHGSYPGLPPEFRTKPRAFYSIRARSDGKPGYVIVANDGTQYAFHKK